jgi:hypothetical protein
MYDGLDRWERAIVNTINDGRISFIDDSTLTVNPEQHLEFDDHPPPDFFDSEGSFDYDTIFNFDEYKWVVTGSAIFRVVSLNMVAAEREQNNTEGFDLLNDRTLRPRNIGALLRDRFFATEEEARLAVEELLRASENWTGDDSDYVWVLKDISQISYTRVVSGHMPVIERNERVAAQSPGYIIDINAPLRDEDILDVHMEGVEFKYNVIDPIPVTIVYRHCVIDSLLTLYGQKIKKLTRDSILDILGIDKSVQQIPGISSNMLKIFCDRYKIKMCVYDVSDKCVLEYGTNNRNYPVLYFSCIDNHMYLRNKPTNETKPLIFDIVCVNEDFSIEYIKNITKNTKLY